jgi:AcrR family transcriptional regulator
VATAKQRPEPPPRSGIANRRAQARDGSNPVYLERRREILAAAARVFKDKGLAAANLSDIASEARVDRASLYYYFDNKETIFHELVREVVAENVAWARAHRDSSAPAPEKLRAMLEALMRSYAENYPLLYVIVQENLSRLPDDYAEWATAIRRANKEFEDIFVQVISDGMKDGALRKVGPPWIVAYGILGMFGWTSRWFNPTTARADADEIASTFIETLLGGLV